MTPRRLSIRICALTVAYALALHGLLAGFAVHAVAAPAAGAMTCLNADGAPAPATPDNHDQGCVLHCLAFSGPHAWTPPLVAVLATFPLSEFRLIALAPAEPIAPQAPKSPQSPRAPPRA